MGRIRVYTVYLLMFIITYLGYNYSGQTIDGLVWQYKVSTATTDSVEIHGPWENPQE